MNVLSRKASTLFKNAINVRSIVSSAFSNDACSSVADAQAAALLADQCILVNEKDEVVGSASKLECHTWDAKLNSCPLHRAFSVFLFNSQGEMLLQQRSSEKVTFPNHITNTCCSHPLSVPDELEVGTGVLVAAKRRLEHELGIPQHLIKTEDMKYLTRIHYYGRVSGSKFAEHEIDYIIFLQQNVPLNPNPEEVRHVEYVKKEHFEDYLKSLESQNIPITPWFGLVAENFLMKWWDNLENLDKFADHQTIHRFVV